MLRFKLLTNCKLRKFEFRFTKSIFFYRTYIYYKNNIVITLKSIRILALCFRAIYNIMHYSSRSFKKLRVFTLNINVFDRQFAYIDNSTIFILNLLIFRNVLTIFKNNLFDRDKLLCQIEFKE